MHQHVGVRMAFQPAAMRDFDPTQSKLAAFDQGVNVVTDANMNHGEKYRNSRRPDQGGKETRLRATQDLLQLKADLAAGAKSTWRPAEGASAKDVAMQVGDGFACVGAVIKHQTESGFAQPQFISNLGGFEQNMAQDLFLFRLSLGD